jgi:AAA domain (dynein-related subfamily)
MEDKEIWTKVITKILLDNKPWDIKKNSEKYHVVLKATKMPPKVVYARSVDYIIKHYPKIEVPSRMPGGLPTNQFIESFNFKITEDLVYNNTEIKKFKEHYNKKIKNKEIFQEYIHFGNQLLEDSEVDTYKVRMAIEASGSISIIVGMRSSYSYNEESGKSRIGFLISKEFSETTEGRFNYVYTYDYKGNPLQNFIKLEIEDWRDIPVDILQEHKKQFKLQYDTIKDSKLTQWNVEANTTNSVIKYLMFEDMNIEYWINNTKKSLQNHSMEFFTNEEFEILEKYSRKKYNKQDSKSKKVYDFLNKPYKKNEFWAQQVQQRIFPNGVQKTHKRPTNQGNYFDGYLWSKIYPTQEDYKDKWLAYTIGISRNSFEIKIDTVGITDDSQSPRKEYIDYRGDFFNSSIVNIYPKNKFDNWDDLIDQTVKDLYLLTEDYNTIKQFNTKQVINSIKKNNGFALNHILYGPPGTGKTYKLQAEYFSKYTISEANLTKEQHIENIFNDLNWFQVITLIVLELGVATVSEIMEHPFFPLKSKSSSAKNMRAQVWGNLQSHTVEYCEQVKYTRRVNPLIFNKDKDGNWTIVSKELEEQFPEALDMLSEINNFQPSADKHIKNYEFVTFHQSFSYEDFVEGIKPRMVEGETDLGYEIEDGVFKKLSLRAKADPDNNYAIFIDEINRGNVSAIFGELITLIEKDKRAGAKNALEVQLPYSKEKFSVPINLHIYGTMNTADRSVEALDTALRRRFEFKEMMPDLTVIEGKSVDNIALLEVLKTINERVELLIDRDHTIGHSYFMNVTTKEALASAFNNKIVPLLQEYFYGDYGKIGLVLGKGFVEKIKNDNINFASFDYDNANDFKTPTFVLKRVTSDSIIDAVNILLAKKEPMQNQ